MITNIPAARAMLLDPRTGMITRDWYRFLQLLLEYVGGVSGVMPPSSGGTGLDTYDQGDTLYASATNTLARLPKTATVSYLDNSGTTNNPAWKAKAALTKADDTNVTLTLGGTPTTSLLTAVSITVGWTGTLDATRLNANVVQAVSNDTNVTGSISAQTLTLGWTGTLSATRGGLGANNATPGTGTFPRGNGTSFVTSTLTIPNTLSSGSILYGTSSNVVGSAANFTFNGTIMTAPQLRVDDGTTRINIQTVGANVAIQATPSAGGTSDIELYAGVTNSTIITPTGVWPGADNTYYLGKNDDDTPKAWKGLILKDQTTGTYYRLQVDSGAVTLIDLTD